MSRSSIPAKRSADAQEAAWVADEDRFVLQQARKKAVLRAKSGRAQPIDWLTVILVALDPDRNPLDDELDLEDFDIISPQTLYDSLDDAQLSELEKRIESIQALDKSKSNHDYWKMMKAICRDRLSSTQSTAARGIGSVAPDLDKMLGNKSLADLEKLERQVKAKLESNEPIDVDYWEHLERSILTYKARAKLKSISTSMLEIRSRNTRRQQILEANALKQRLRGRLASNPMASLDQEVITPGVRHPLDPEPLSRIRPEDKSCKTMTLKDFADQIATKQVEVASTGYVSNLKQDDRHLDKRQKLGDGGSASAAFDREVARGLGDNEEILSTEEEVITKNRHLWTDKYRPRKPQYFNRAQLGFDWNKYNQTHYDQENPPPRVVQGYKFNIFYPDLADKTKAPTYRIERENGRRRGESLAPAGEDDTCLIRFMAGPPYEDVAFRIVDKEWDYSAKRERGFKSSFDKDILQLHFQFKKIFYRK